MRRIRVAKTHTGRWLAGVVGHPFAVDTYETWAEAIDNVPFYLAVAHSEAQSAAALGAAFDRMFPEETADA